MQKRGSVLIIDDDIVFLKLTEETLSEHYAVSVAKSAARAIGLIHSGFLPDIVLLDVDMPQMDGFEAINKLQEIEAMQCVPIIFLTGAQQTDSELRGLHAGAVDYITKPFVKEVLIARIHVHMEMGCRQRELQRYIKEIEFDNETFCELTKDLTPTEQKIAMLVAQGYSNQEISEQLCYSYSYVKKVVSIVFEKIGVNKRRELRKFFKTWNHSQLHLL